MNISNACFVRNIVPSECLIGLSAHTGLWGAEEFIQTKVEQEAEYKDRIRKRFGEVDQKG